MLVINAKQGIESAFQKVYQASGGKFRQCKIYWHGRTAQVKYERYSDDVCLILPSLDESKVVSDRLFNDLVGFVIHELGHVWFTTKDEWVDACKTHKDGKYLSMLINGLEDPRIENKVIKSGYAPNARDLFNSLINNALDKDGYCDSITKQDLPFILAVEGRRLNGYAMSIPDILVGHECEDVIRQALLDASKAVDTSGVVRVAERLYATLFDDDGEGVEDEPKEADKPKDEEGRGEKDGKGDKDSKDSKGGKDDRDGRDGKADEKQKGGVVDKPRKSVRNPEINEYIDGSLKMYGTVADKLSSRPVLRSSRIIDLIFS